MRKHNLHNNKISCNVRKDTTIILIGCISTYRRIQFDIETVFKLVVPSILDKLKKYSKLNINVQIQFKIGDTDMQRSSE